MFQVAKDAANIPDLFVGEVGIKDYGEKGIFTHNQDIFTCKSQIKN